MPSEQERVERWLQRCVGEWAVVTDAKAASGDAYPRIIGSESVRPFGGTWMSFDSRITEPASDASRTLMTLGFDASLGRVVGAVVTSMMSNLWVYDGVLDENGQSLTLETTGPDYAIEGATGRYRDTMTIERDDRRVFTSSYLGGDGEWHEFMRSVYERTA